MKEYWNNLRVSVCQHDKSRLADLYVEQLQRNRELSVDLRKRDSIVDQKAAELFRSLYSQVADLTQAKRFTEMSRDFMIREVNSLKTELRVEQSLSDDMAKFGDEMATKAEYGYNMKTAIQDWDAIRIRHKNIRDRNENKNSRTS